MYVLKQVGSKGFALSEKIQDGSLDMATHTKQEEYLQGSTCTNTNIYLQAYISTHKEKNTSAMPT